MYKWLLNPTNIQMNANSFLGLICNQQTYCLSHWIRLQMDLTAKFKVGVGNDKG